MDPLKAVQPAILGSLSSDVFERRTSTGNRRFALLSRDFEQIFGQIVSVRIKILGNINTVASRLIKRGKGSLPVDVRRSKTSLLKLPTVATVTYSKCCICCKSALNTTVLKEHLFSPSSKLVV